MHAKLEPPEPMQRALAEAKAAARRGEVPVGAVIVGPDGLIYFCTSNRDGRGAPVQADDRIGRLVPAS